MLLCQAGLYANMCHAAKFHLLGCRQGKLFLRAWLAGLVTVGVLYFSRLVLYRSNSVVAERNYLTNSVVAERNSFHKLGVGRGVFFLLARLWPRGIVA